MSAAASGPIRPVLYPAAQTFLDSPAVKDGPGPHEVTIAEARAGLVTLQYPRSDAMVLGPVRAQ